MDADGGDERQVPGLVIPDYYDQLSPSRAQMVYWDYEGSVILYDMGTLEKTTVLTDTEAEYAGLDWSYDGKYVAALKSYPPPYRTAMDVLDVESREVVWTRQDVYAFYYWSPTDNVLLVRYYDEAVDQRGGWLVNIENGTVIRIDDDERDENSYKTWDFSPDGQKLAAVPYSVEQDGYLAIYEPMNKSWHELLPQIVYEDYEVHDRVKWSPDGRQIAYVASFRMSGQSFSKGLFVVDVATNEHRLLVEQQYPINLLLWSPDSQEILFDEGSETRKVSIESGLITLLDDGSRVGDVLAWVWEAY
ncbi:MAG: WD40 repeat domain-containing protein [Anaerolineae bacterium]|nr:WD40 repeat domain-containing protein [Anaerolineae bacterium]